MQTTCAKKNIQDEFATRKFESNSTNAYQNWPEQEQQVSTGGYKLLVF